MEKKNKETDKFNLETTFLGGSMAKIELILKNIENSCILICAASTE